MRSDRIKESDLSLKPQVPTTLSVLDWISKTINSLEFELSGMNRRESNC
jgi:hypothetical protein